MFKITNFTKKAVLNLSVLALLASSQPAQAYNFRNIPSHGIFALGIAGLFAGFGVASAMLDGKVADKNCEDCQKRANAPTVKEGFMAAIVVASVSVLCLLACMDKSQQWRYN